MNKVLIENDDIKYVYLCEDYLNEQKEGKMGIINMEYIQEGMILAANIKERSGRVLLAKDSAITEKHLRVFKIWGITDADIKGIETDELAANVAAQLDQHLLQEIEVQTRERFYHVDMDHPFIKELFRLLTIRQVRRRSRGQNDV